MRPEDFSESEVRNQYADALNRAATWTGQRVGIGTIVHYAKLGGYQPPTIGGQLPVTSVGDQDAQPFDLDAAVPIYSQTGMRPRAFAGPSLGNAYLFRMNALSLLDALGGIGKTTAIMKIAAHIAAGKSWGAEPLKKRKVLGVFIEESQAELNRKYGASVHSWTDAERAEAEANLRLISCLERDPRLTKAMGRQVDVTDFNQRIIEAALEFGAKVIVLDHLQGFARGDLNNSDTATALARASNTIVAQTRAAVILAAHVSKGNIGAQSVIDGFTTGSLAFENAARQVTGIIPMPTEVAEKFGLDPSEYLRVEMPKNSYGPSRQIGYLKRVYVPDFHTITVEPFSPIPLQGIRSANDRVKDTILNFVKTHPGTTPNKLDGLSGKAGQFKATKQAIRSAAKELQDEGRLIVKPLTKEERVALRLPHQAKQVYEHV